MSVLPHNVSYYYCASALRRLCIYGLLFAVLVGCKVNLYSSLSEVEANLMVAALLENGVYAEKSGSEGAYLVRVDDADVAKSIVILTAKGLPKDARVNVGTIFQKSGIISSPFEDRVRYVYALGQELSDTLNQIEGVITTRVHVVLPDQSQLGQPARASSAAVFIKFQPESNLDYLVPQIRRLVSSSIEGLTPETVAVVLIKGAAIGQNIQKIERQVVNVIPRLAVRETDVEYFWRIVYVSGLLIISLIGLSLFCLIYVFILRRKLNIKDSVSL